MICCEICFNPEPDSLVSDLRNHLNSRSGNPNFWGHIIPHQKDHFEEPGENTKKIVFVYIYIYGDVYIYVYIYIWLLHGYYMVNDG